ncbi:hypothetical protein [Patulibacter defluvii]|uniref:hypothetical protein n=1 Tax=Patulibacter defluvii TaxID=3095358 RepID=UPI002A763E04|nr:hypothetical protein [Patulibacter sp. DM4]
MTASARIAGFAAAVATVAALGVSTASAQTVDPPDQIVTPGTLAPPDGSRNPNQNSCHFNLKSQKRTKGEDLRVDYTLQCALPINAYSVSVSADGDEPVSLYGGEIFPHKKTGEVLADQSFGCFGELPGWGFNCTGSYGGAYALIPGTFDLDVPAAITNLRNVPGLKVTVTTIRWTGSPDGKGGFKKNADGSPTIVGAIAGPFKAKLRDPKPVAKKAKAKAKKAKAAAKTRRAAR